MNSLPFILSATATMTARTTKSILDQTRLKNPFDGAMLIKEIRFLLEYDTSIDTMAAPRIRVALRMGEHYLTQQPVPVWLFGKLLNNLECDVDTGDSRVALAYTWRLPQPLYVPEGTYLEPVFYYEPMFLSIDTPANPEIITRITYVCQSVEKESPPPASIRVPWVTPWITNESTNVVTGIKNTYKSTPSNLVNPFNVPLHVQRFVGRIAGVLTDSQVPGEPGVTNEGLIDKVTTVRMTSSKGTTVVKDNTPFAHLFNFQDRSWTVNCQLAPNGFYLATITQDFTEIGALDIFVVNMISMIGSREVQL